MSNVLDLTRDREGKLRSFSNISKPKPPNTSSLLPPFLQEVDLGGIRACYIKSGVPDMDTYSYDLAWMKIPEGFQFVEYQLIDDVPHFDYQDEHEMKVNLLTPILWIHESPKPALLEHICTTFSNVVQLSNGCIPGNPLGCTTILKSPTQTTKPTNFLSTDFQSSEQPFYLFSYNGKLRTNPDDESSEGKEIEGGYFVIPLILSNRTIVYYSFPKSEFKKNYDLALDALYGEVRSPLTMNDEKEIFVTNKIEWVKPLVDLDNPIHP